MSTCFYDFLCTLGETGTYSEKINNITYKVQHIYESVINDENLNDVLSLVDSKQDEFLYIHTKSLNITGELTPPYPKKSLIITADEIDGNSSAKISMTAKAPDCLPEDIFLSFEGDDLGDLLIPAYANNAKSVSGFTGRHNQPIGQVENRRGVDGTDYNCGSGGIGGAATTNWGYDRMSITARSGSGYSYGGGAGTGGFSGNGTVTSNVDSTYPMHGSNGIAGSYYTAGGGSGKPPGNTRTGSDAKPAPILGNGCGGRLIIFTNNIKDISLESRGSWCTQYSHSGGGGSSGGGSINVFYRESANYSVDVSSKDATRGDSYNTSLTVFLGAAGGSGTHTSELKQSLRIINPCKFLVNIGYRVVTLSDGKWVSL